MIVKYNQYIKENIRDMMIPENSESILNYKKDLSESLRDKMKPKSEDEIRKSLGNIDSAEKLKLACEKNVYWLAKEAIKELGYDMTKDLLNNPRKYYDHYINDDFFISLVPYNDINISKLLFENGIDLNKYKNLIFDAIESNNVELVKYLIDNKFYDVHYKNDMPLLYAVKNGDINMAKLLVDYGSDVKKILRIVELKYKNYFDDYDDNLNKNIQLTIDYLKSVS